MFVCFAFQSNVGSPEVAGVLVIREVVVTGHLNNTLVAVGVGHQLSLNGGVFELTGTTVEVPGVPDHKLEVVILIDGGGDVSVVVDEFGDGDLVVALASVPLGHELHQDVVLAHLASLELGVLGDVVGACDVVQLDHAAVVAVKLVVSHLDELNSTVGHITADSYKELVVTDLSVIVLVEEFEDALKLRGAQGVAVLAQTPHELVSVHLLVTVVVHAAEDDSEAADTVSTTGLQGVEDLLENLIGRLSLDTEDRVDVGVVAAALDSEPSGELLIVELVVAVLVVLGKESTLLELGEATAHGLEGASEL